MSGCNDAMMQFKLIYMYIVHCSLLFQLPVLGGIKRPIVLDGQAEASHSRNGGVSKKTVQDNRQEPLVRAALPPNRGGTEDPEHNPLGH